MTSDVFTTDKSNVTNRPEMISNDVEVKSSVWSDSTNRRLFFFVAFLVLCLSALVFKYANFMIGKTLSVQTSQIDLPDVERGPILDRNGKLLALTIQKNSVTSWAPAVREPEDSAYLLSKLLGANSQDILRRIKQSEGFTYIQRHITSDQSAAIRKAKDKGQLRGIYLEPEQTRSYPEGELAAHVIGFVGVDNIGLEGIENTYNNVLAPDTIPSKGTKVFGNRLFLTIDVNVQYAAEKIANSAISKHDADKVFVLVAKADTGEILAYASQPSYNPNSFSASSPERWRNSIATSPFEPGSVLKIFTMAALLETGVATTTMTFPSPGYYQRILPNGTTIRIGDLGDYGDLTMEDILQYSSNAGTAHASELISEESFYHMLRLFGFGQLTGIPFRAESPGLLRTIDQWSGRTKPTIAIGHEIAITPLQIIQAATALTNDGVLLRPQIIREVMAANGKILKPFAVESVHSVISPQVAAHILRMMEKSAQEGTGQLAQTKGFRVATKTGTAQIFDPTEKKYSNEKMIASILGLFPANDPKFIAYIVIHNPKGEQRYGGLIAAPLLREMTQFLAIYYLLPSDSQQVLEHPSRIVVAEAPPLVLSNRLPDLKGLPKRALLPLIASSSLKVTIHGSGYVIRQYPDPGSVTNSNEPIHIWLE